MPKAGFLGFEMNERCAAGTGRFFQVMAKVLACGLEGIGAEENISTSPANISNQCSVFAESEVISLVNNTLLCRISSRALTVLWLQG